MYCPGNEKPTCAIMEIEYLNKKEKKLFSSPCKQGIKYCLMALVILVHIIANNVMLLC